MVLLQIYAGFLLGGVWDTSFVGFKGRREFVLRGRLRKFISGEMSRRVAFGGISKFRNDPRGTGICQASCKQVDGKKHRSFHRGSGVGELNYLTKSRVKISKIRNKPAGENENPAGFF